MSFIGPFDGPGVAITSQALAIGLQAYAGKNFSFYLTGKGQDTVSRGISPADLSHNISTPIV